MNQNARNPLISRRAALLGAAAIVAVPAHAAQGALALIMVDEPGCRYCRQFDSEIGGRYSKTAEGRFAPLVKVRRKSTELAGLNPVIYTPTFILVRRGEELGRITGYPGREYFFGELDTLLAKIGFAPGLTGNSAI
jgi:thioredoxin-related protein